MKCCACEKDIAGEEYIDLIVANTSTLAEVDAAWFCTLTCLKAWADKHGTIERLLSRGPSHP